jgi:hypothetical protein
MASGCTPVFPSIRIYQHGLHLTDTRAPFNIRSFMKICQENSDMVKIGENSGHFRFGYKSVKIPGTFILLKIGQNSRHFHFG